MPDKDNSFIISADDPILITGAAGFIGSRVVEGLLDHGFRNLVCFCRPTGNLALLQDVIKRRSHDARVKFVRGNLLSPQDCQAAVKDVSVVYHLAAGTGEKSFADAYMNSVVTTRNLLDAGSSHGRLRRVVLVSSFSVYTNRQKLRGKAFDELCPIEEHAERRGEAYAFGKVKQEEIVKEYGKNFGIPYVVVRPGTVYGPGKRAIPGRVGIDTFGLFLHVGGPNILPLTYVDNCADAIVLAGLAKGVDGETFNVVDDELPSSRNFLRLYKKNVKAFRSIYIPHLASYAMCYLWEWYAEWSRGQLPRAFNRKRWYTYWKRTRYSNAKLKQRLGWTPKVSTAEGLRRYFQVPAQTGQDA